MEQYAMEAIIIVLPRSNEQPEWQKSNIALITIGDHVLKYTVKDIMKRTMVWDIDGHYERVHVLKNLM